MRTRPRTSRPRRSPPRVRTRTPQAPRAHRASPKPRRRRTRATRGVLDARHPRERADRGGAVVRVAYWPGCVSRGFTPELHGSMAKVAPLLDLELIELDRACCTGAGVIAEHNQELADTLNARTFALAQQVDGAELMINICSTCQGAQSECQERLDANAEYRAHVNETLAGERLGIDREHPRDHYLHQLIEALGGTVIEYAGMRKCCGFPIVTMNKEG